MQRAFGSVPSQRQHLLTWGSLLNNPSHCQSEWADALWTRGRWQARLWGPRTSAGGGAGAGRRLTGLAVRAARARLRAGSSWAWLLGAGYGSFLWKAGIRTLEDRASRTETSPQAGTHQRCKRLSWLRLHGLSLAQGQKRDILPPPPSSPATLDPRKPSLPGASKFPSVERS